MLDTIYTLFMGFLGLTVLFVIWCIMSFNRLNKLRARCSASTNDVDVQLKRRSDLLPNLATTVKKFVGQENRVLDLIGDVQRDANASNSINSRATSSANISNSISSLFSSMDQIPQLQSSSHYTGLRDELLNVEDQISASRRFQNLAVSEFNAARSSFPGILVASFAKMGDAKGYELGADRIFHDEAPAINI